MKKKYRSGNPELKSLLIVFLLFSTICFAQKNIAYADSIRQSYAIPEINYAVISDTSVLDMAALGYHSVNLNDTATLDDRFHLGSNTKAMTAFLLARYVEKGKLQWKTKFFDVFPEWKQQSRAEYYSITLQDLLSHRALIQPFLGENDPTIPTLKGSKQQKRTLFGKFVLTLDPVKNDTVHPFTYSNADYTLATLLLERTTGSSWEQLVDQVFNKELHLDVQLSWPDNQSKKETWGHSFENDKLVPVPSSTDYHLDYTEPAGDINIKLTAYIKFIQLNLQGLNGQDNYLKAATYHFIHEGIEGYALGWFNIYENGSSYSAHSGTAGTYYSLVQLDRENSRAYIILTNSFSEETISGVRLLMRHLKECYHSPQ
jgi:CubicO group peptidase (beta-lactamase class C family)